MKFICNDVDDKGNPIPDSGCGTIPHIIFDGYSFGDRQLEGVNFIAKVGDGGEVVVETADDWSANRYLKGLNKEYWLEQAKGHIATLDIATCPNCGNDIDAQPRE